MSGFPFLLIFALYAVTPITMDVYPQVSMAPATFRFRVVVPRNQDNRMACWAYRGPEEKQSCVQIDGWQAQRSWTVYWELRTAGEYEAVAVLTRIELGKEKVYVDRRPFRVIGIEPY